MGRLEWVSWGPQAFMLAAMKLHCHWTALPQRSPSDPRPLKAAIDKGITYMVHLVRSRCAAVQSRCAAGAPPSPAACTVLLFLILLFCPPFFSFF